MKRFMKFLLEQETVTVEHGDTMYGLSKKKGIPTQAFLDANPDIDPNNLQIGQKLNWPTPQKPKPIPTKPPSTHDYAQSLVDQSKKFAKYGKEPTKAGYHPRYDYGGGGDVPVNRESYTNVAKGVMRGMMTDIGISSDKQLDNPKDRERLVQRWRGASREEDPRYYTEVDKAYKSGSDCVGAFCTAIEQAETGSEKNPFIRTRHAPEKGSTAYGPMQITGTTLRDFLTRYPQNFPK